MTNELKEIAKGLFEKYEGEKLLYITEKGVAFMGENKKDVAFGYGSKFKQKVFTVKVEDLEEAPKPRKPRTNNKTKKTD